MQRQLRAFISLPQTWKQTPDKTHDNDPFFFSPLHPHFSLTSCSTNHFFPFQLHSAFSSALTQTSHPLSPSLPCQSLPHRLHRLSCLYPPLCTSLFGLQRFFLALLASLCLLPSQAEATWFRVGVVGPWGCDPLFAKALPNVAAQLAVNRINKDPSLSHAATFDYAVLQVHSWSCISKWKSVKPLNVLN